MIINGFEIVEGLDCVRIIEELVRVFRKYLGLRNILFIIIVKVLIVKFFYLRSGLEVDISLYNILVFYNIRFLFVYFVIDFRVKYLCYIMKVFIKMCDIGDVFRGSLLLYVYIFMVLYFF